MIWFNSVSIRMCVLLLSIINLCRSQEYTIVYDVDEEKPNGTEIGILKDDAELNVIPAQSMGLQYAFLTRVGRHASLFHLDADTSNLTVLSEIDREAECKSALICEFIVEVAVRSADIYFEIIKVKIVINDINDNGPEFSPASSVALEIQESDSTGAVFPLVQVKDSDIGLNSQLNFQILPDNPSFNLKATLNGDKSSSLSLVVEEKLDREVIDAYQLLIVATDNGQPQQFGNFSVNITVTDANDNRPEFSQSVYNVSVKENAPKYHVVTMLTATDKDLGLFGRITYSLSSDTETTAQALFEVVSETGEIRVIQEIMSAKKTSYTLIVKAEDGGSPALISQATVNIAVMDTSNNPPHVTVNLLTSTTDTTEISESVKLGYFVAHVRVTDADTGNNGKVSCSIQNDNFELQPYGTDYKIVVAKELDREHQMDHSIQITCQDRGNPPSYGAASFNVHLLDENDNAPKFSRNKYIVKIPENNKIGAILAQVAANDLDIGENGKVEYRLHSDAGLLVSIQETSGVLLANVAFNREDIPTVTFHVLAVDRGSSPLTSTAVVVLNIEDRNDNTPYLSVENNLRIAEKQPVGTAVGQILAIDRDVGTNAEITYQLVSDRQSNSLFTLNTEGTLFTKAIFNKAIQDVYVIRVKVTDKGIPSQSSEGNLDIYVIEAKNLHYPIVTFPNEINNTFVINQISTSFKTIVLTIEAYDHDTGIDGKLTYFIIDGNKEGLFDLNLESAILSMSDNIKASSLQLYDGEYPITVLVQDLGTNPKSAEIMFTLIIKANNYSLASTNDDKNGNQNIVIAATVTVVTVVMSAGIVIIIIYVLRMGGRKRNQNENPPQINEGLSTITGTMPNGTAGDGGSSSGSMPEPSSPGSLSINHKALQLPQASSTLLSQKTPPPQNDLQTNWPTAYHQVNAENHLQQNKPLSPIHAIHKVDDNHSESSGEVTISDSGHGDSEEDGHQYKPGMISEQEYVQMLQKHLNIWPVSSTVSYVPYKYAENKTVPSHPAYRQPDQRTSRDLNTQISHSENKLRLTPSVLIDNSHQSGDSKTCIRQSTQYAGQHNLTKSNANCGKYNHERHVSFVSESEEEDDASTTTSGTYTVSGEDDNHYQMCAENIYI